MNPWRTTAAKVGGFTLALAVLAGGGYAVGQGVNPVVAAGTEDAAHDESGDGADESSAAAVEVPGGLQVSDNGYTLVPTVVPTAPGVEQPLSLRIVGPDGAAVTEFEKTHDKELHLIVVRRDLSGFQHVHPTMADDGTWSFPLTFPAAGTYRLFADFQPSGADDGQTLGADVQIAGDYQPTPLAAPSRVATVDDYEVRLDGELVPGTASRLTLTVSKDGQPMTDLEPYLAAYGHLVALRDRDLAYLDVHPDGEPGDGRTEPGPSIVFYAEVPSTGDYRLFLDFAHDGVVRTAEFTAAATGEARGDAPSHDEHGSEDE